MNKILIVYIATAAYNRMFDGFYKSLTRFCPGIPKDIVVFTDNWSDYIQYQTTVNVDVNVISVNTIDHSPWPIVALNKFKYILTAIEHNVGLGYTHVFYFNSNIEFRKVVPSDIFISDEVIAVDNCGWEYVGMIPERLTYNRPLDKKSATYIPGWYRYVQSSVMGGPINEYCEMCRDAQMILQYDLAHNRIPVFHDETAWNKVVWENKFKIKYLTADFNSCAVNHKRNGFPDPHIVMRDSSLTQTKYKDDYHKISVKVPEYIARIPLDEFDSMLVNNDIRRIVSYEYFYNSIYYHGFKLKSHEVVLPVYEEFIKNCDFDVEDNDTITVVYSEPDDTSRSYYTFNLKVNDNKMVEVYG